MYWLHSVGFIFTLKSFFETISAPYIWSDLSLNYMSFKKQIFKKNPSLLSYYSYVSLKYRKLPAFKLNENLSSGSLVVSSIHADGQTDRMVFTLTRKSLGHAEIRSYSCTRNWGFLATTNLFAAQNVKFNLPPLCVSQNGLPWCVSHPLQNFQVQAFHQSMLITGKALFVYFRHFINLQVKNYPPWM